MPRSSPVMTGLPRSVGFCICSDDAKNASPSICKIARGNERILKGDIRALVLANNSLYDSNNFQVFFRIYGLVCTIGRLKIKAVLSLPKIFHRPLTIDLGDNDASHLWAIGTFHDDQITLLNT